MHNVITEPLDQRHLFPVSSNHEHHKLIPLAWLTLWALLRASNCVQAKEVWASLVETAWWNLQEGKQVKQEAEKKKKQQQGQEKKGYK